MFQEKFLVWVAGYSALPVVWGTRLRNQGGRIKLLSQDILQCRSLLDKEMRQY